MTELGTIAEMAYDHNSYRENRRDSMIQQDAEFIDMSFERMVQMSGEVIPDLNYTPKILELGCGAGVPYTQYLSRYGNLVGCDVSGVQIEHAKQNVPNARFIQKDVMDLHLRKKYDIIAMFHSFFNVDRMFKPILLRKINYWLSSYGVVIITTYGDETVIKHKDDFYGMPMTWHHISVSDFEKLVTQAGFSVVDHSERTDNIGDNETHLWLLEKSI